jgi:hypothetical protein
MSTIKVNTITKRTGSTLTLGECGATVQLATGATQTGFGRTGTVDWCTTAKTLPASPSAGDIISLKDYANTWDTNAVTLCRNGSKINGVCANVALNTESQSVTLIYVDGTKGWQDIQDSTSNVTGLAFIEATGGTVITCGDYKTHVFTSDGTFSVSTANVPSNNFVDYLVVGGGGGGSKGRAGGAGAGGFRVSNGTWAVPAPSISPLAACVASLPVSVQAYPITIGGGGAGKSGPPNGNGTNGVDTVFSTITSAGGGAGASDGAAGGDGGSGGGGGESSVSSVIGAGNTPPVSPPQGNPGGASQYAPPTGGPHPTSPQPYAGGGGGGAGAPGGRSCSSPGNNGGVGGTGSYIPNTYFGPTAPSYGTSGPVSSTRYFSGGGAGNGCAASNPGSAVPAPLGGGGGGTSGPCSASSGTANTGGGGAAWGDIYNPGAGGSGGSGVVIIRYKFQ